MIDLSRWNFLAWALQFQHERSGQKRAGEVLPSTRRPPLPCLIRPGACFTDADRDPQTDHASGQFFRVGRATGSLDENRCDQKMAGFLQSRGFRCGLVVRSVGDRRRTAGCGSPKAFEIGGSGCADGLDAFIPWAFIQLDVVTVQQLAAGP